MNPETKPSSILHWQFQFARSKPAAWFAMEGLCRNAPTIPRFETARCESLISAFVRPNTNDISGRFGIFSFTVS